MSKFDWDPLWRPVEHGLNILFSAGVGIVNTMDKGIGLIKPLEENETYWDKIGDFTTAFGSGMVAALTNNTDSEDYVLGHDLIENASDAFGGRFNPDYEDVDDNVNPWVKGIGGFALDVALDPITYIPGGIIASGLRGARAGAKAVKGLDKIQAGLKGAVKGTAEGDRKFGRWSGAIKPVGWEQWGANRALEKVDRIARKERISPDRARFLAPMEMAKADTTYQQVAEFLNREGADALLRFADDPKSLAAAQKNVRTDWTAKALEDIGRTVEPLSKNINDFANARSIGQKAGANKRRIMMEARKSGVSSYLHRSQAERNAVIFAENQLEMAQRGMQDAFYASAKGIAAPADEVADPLMAALQEELKTGFAAAPYTGTQAEDAMTRIDLIFGVGGKGVTKFLVDTRRKIMADDPSKDFVIKGMGDKDYTFSSLLEAFSVGTNIGLTGTEASVFGRTLGEFLYEAHEVRPKIPQMLGPQRTYERRRPAKKEKPAVRPETAPVGQEVALRAPEPSVEPEIAPQGALGDEVPIDVTPERLFVGEPADAKELWDEATISVQAKIVTELNDEAQALTLSIKTMRETRVNVSDFTRRGPDGKLGASMGGAVSPQKGVLTASLKKAGVEYVIDTRPIPRFPAGPLEHLDKTALSADLKAEGIKYGALGELSPMALDSSPNGAMYSLSEKNFSQAMADPAFVQGVEQIVEQLDGARKVALLVFEGTGAHNSNQWLVAQALNAQGFQARLVLQKGAAQGQETMDLLTSPMEIRMWEAAREWHSMIAERPWNTETNELAGQIIFRASAERQEEGVRAILDSEDKSKWVGNVQEMLAENAQDSATPAESIAKRSNILTNLLVAHQRAPENLVASMLAWGGAKRAGNYGGRDAETFFRAIFGDDKPIRESFLVEPAKGTVKIEGDIEQLDKLSRESTTGKGKALEEAERAYEEAREMLDNEAQRMMSELEDETQRLIDAAGNDPKKIEDAEVAVEKMQGAMRQALEEMDDEAEKLGKFTDDEGQYIVDEHDVVMQAMALLTEMPVKMTGYTDKAKAVYAAIATEKMLKSNQLTKRTEIGATRKEAFSEERGWAAANYGRAFQENPGETINIFGQVIPGGESAVAKEMQKVIQQLGDRYLADAEAPPLLADQVTAYKYFTQSLTPDIPTSNVGGRNVPIMRGTPSDKYKAEGGPVQERWLNDVGINDGPKAVALREELGRPWSSPELDDIYDHVAGFAKAPIGSIRWEDALRRVAKMYQNDGVGFVMRNRAAGLVKEIESARTPRFTVPSIENFRGTNSFLSNFHEAKVTIGGVTYSNAEAAFQAAKSTDPQVQATFVNMSGKEAKAAGKKIKLRPDWEARKVSIMEKILETKFAENPELAEKLIATKGSELLEGNIWNDAFWGVNEKTGKGQNMLGKTLMKLRDSLDPENAPKPHRGIIDALYEKTFKDWYEVEADASKNFGVDLFGRVFRDRTPQKIGSTQKEYNATIKDKGDKAFGNKVWSESLKHETTKQGITYVKIEEFAKALAKKYGVVRQQELMPFIRQIEADRTIRQAQEMLEQMDANLGDAGRAELVLREQDPLYRTLSPFDRLPDETRAVVALASLRTSLSTIRRAVQNVDKNSVLTWYKNIASKKNMRYTIVTKTARFSAEELDGIKGKLGNVATSKKILALAEDGVGASVSRTLRQGDLLAKDGQGVLAGAYKDEYGPNNLNRQADNFAKGDDIKGGLTETSSTSREVMDLVRAEDLGPGFWQGLGGDQFIDFKATDEVAVKEFIDGVVRILGIGGDDVLPGRFYEIEGGTSARELITQALIAAVKTSDPENTGNIGFVYSDFVNETLSILRSSKTSGVRAPKASEVRDAMLNGVKVDGFTAKMLSEAADVETVAELVGSIDNPNLWYPVNPEAIRGVISTLQNKYATDGSMIPSLLKEKKYVGIYDTSKEAMAKAAKAITDDTVPHGTAIEARMLEMGEEGLERYVIGRAETIMGRVNQVQNEGARGIIINAGVDGAQAGLVKMRGRVQKKLDNPKDYVNARGREFTQSDETAVFENVRQTVHKKFAEGSPEAWKAQQMARALAQASLHQQGVFQVTTLYSVPGRKFTVDYAQDHNWSYLDFMDTYRAIAVPDPQFDAFAREAMDLYEVDGLRFPQTLLPEMGTYAMKLHRTPGLGANERSVLMHDYAKSRLNQMEMDGKKVYKGWAEEVDLFEGESFGNSFISKIVERLSDSKVGAQLYETHLNNGAAAIKVSEANSREIVQPIFDKLMDVAGNIQRSYADAPDAIIASIAELRKVLAAKGFPTGTPEALISKNALQKAQTELFSVLDMNAARNASRMGRAVKLGQDGVTELTDAQVAARIQAVADNVAFVENRAMPEAMRKKARLRIEKIRAVANTERASLAAESVEAAQEIVIMDIVKMARVSMDTDDPELLMMAYEKAINVGEHIQRTNELLQESFRSGRARFDAETMAAYVARGVPEETYEQAVKVTSEADRVDLASQVTSKGVKGALIGDHKMAEVKGPAAGIGIDFDSQANIGEKAIEAAIKQVQKHMGDTKGPAAEAWHTRLVLATFGTNRYDFIAQEADPVLQELGREILKVWRVLVDTGEGGLLARSGLDSNWVNTFLAKSPMGGKSADGTPFNIETNQLPPNMMGWELSKLIPKYLENLMTEGVGKGGRSALQVFKGFNYALHEAGKAPAMAAQFSANFGHRSWGYLTAADAVNNGGFKQIKSGPGSGNLAQWLDPSQAYPPEFINQLANLQKFLDFDTTFKNPTVQKIMTALDKITSVMKSSLTIWRPGHHVVSAVGDGLMNLLDGVVNPYRYYQAMRVMRSSGQFHQGTIFGRDKGAQFGKFMGEYDDAVGGAKGIDVQIGGVNRTLSDTGLYKMLDDAGALINNNTAEDLLAIGDEISLSGGKLTQLFRPIVKTNRALGEFSARRDNVLRLAHAIDLMKRRSWSSVQEMQDHVVREIVAWHPTLQALSGFERKYMRRMFYFYTWMRNAATKVFETIVEDPRYLTIAPKANVAASVGMGGDPQSLGQPMPNDARLPEFAARNILGPAWYDDNGNVVGITINSPQLDIFQDLIGKISVDPNASLGTNLTENAMLVIQENTIGFLAPGPKFVGEFLSQDEYKEYGMTPISDWGEHLIDQTGLGIISRSTGRSLINQNGLLGVRTDIEDNPADQTKKQIQTGLNAVTGAKWTEWSKWYKVAARERSERNSVYLEGLTKRLNGG